MVRIADALIVHGPRLRAELIRSVGVSGDCVHVVPHGNYEHTIVRYDRADARRRLALPAEGPVFSFVGQLLPRKGVDTLVEAFLIHCERGLPGVLVVAGPAYGVDESELRRRIGPHEERVHWMTGARHLPAEQLDLAVSAATQVVLPFHEATQSGSLLFSMTHGRCVVTTDVGEVTATVGEHGLVVPPRNAAALAGALELAVRDPEGCDRLGRAARAYVLDKLDWCRVAALTLSVYTARPEQRGARGKSAAVGSRSVSRCADARSGRLSAFGAPLHRNPLQRPGIDTARIRIVQAGCLERHHGHVKRVEDQVPSPETSRLETEAPQPLEPERLNALRRHAEGARQVVEGSADGDEWNRQ